MKSGEGRDGDKQRPSWQRILILIFVCLVAIVVGIIAYDVVLYLWDLLVDQGVIPPDL